AAEAELRRRTNESGMARGVTMLDPATTFVDATVELAADVTLFPGTLLQGTCVGGEGSEIGPNTRSCDCPVWAGPTVEAATGPDAVIDVDCAVGPYAVLEPGAHLAAGTRTGAFYTASPAEGP